jgi:hypothetical protein
MAVATFFDSEGNYIGYFENPVFSTTYIDFEVVMPENCYYVAFCSYSYGPDAQPLIVKKLEKKIVNYATEDYVNDMVGNIETLLGGI